MTAWLFGYDGLPETPLTCEEYDRLWEQLNGRPRRGPEDGRLAVFSSYTDDTEMRTAWGFPGQDAPALAETQDGSGCGHWLFAEERTS